LGGFLVDVDSLSHPPGVFHHWERAHDDAGRVLTHIPTDAHLESLARLVRVADGAEVPAADKVHELGCMAVGWVRVFDVETPGGQAVAR
jgi:hypothetical protein